MSSTVILKSLSSWSERSFFTSRFKKIFLYSSNYGMIFLSLFEIGFKTNQMMDRRSFLNEREKANESDN